MFEILKNFRNIGNISRILRLMEFDLENTKKNMRVGIFKNSEISRILEKKPEQTEYFGIPKIFRSE
jgi:hypothetical protein